MVFKANNWGSFPKNFASGMHEVRFMARGGKVAPKAPSGQSPNAPPGLRNTDIPKYPVAKTPKPTDFAAASKKRLGSPSHGKGAPTPGGTRMPKAKGGEVKGALAAPAGAAPRKRGAGLPALNMSARLR